MPKETKRAIEWALKQTYTNFLGEEIEITKDDRQELVDKVREYFNSHDIKYDNFNYQDVKEYF